jgi:hypothetical protein
MKAKNVTKTTYFKHSTKIIYRLGPGLLHGAQSEIVSEHERRPCVKTSALVGGHCSRSRSRMRDVDTFDSGKSDVAEAVGRESIP